MLTQPPRSRTLTSAFLLLITLASLDVTPAFALQLPAALSSDTAQAQTKASEWQQWRGPNRDGILSGVQWPDKIDESSLRKAWSIPLQPSYSGPIVAGNMVFTTQTVDKKNESVAAFNRSTGDKLWESSWQGAMRVPIFASVNGSWIRATPAYSQGRLYVAGMKDVLVCLDAKTGDTVWKIDFPEQMKSQVPKFGFVSSPLIDGDSVYVQAGGAFYRLNKSDGSVIWKTAEDDSGMNGAFSSPVIQTLCGKRQLVVQGRDELFGIEITNGNILWQQTVEAFRGMNILTPTFDGDNIFISSYGGKTRLLSLSKSGEEFTVEKKWTLPADGYMSSPVVIDGFAYTHLRNKRFACYDLAQGVETWRSKGYGKYASLITNGKKSLALSEDGQLLLLKVNPKEFELLDKRTVGDNNWAHLAIAGNQIFVRGLKDLTMYQWLGVQSGSSD